MSATMTPAITTADEQQIVLNNVGWDQYQTITDALPEASALKTVYIDRRLTLVSPSRRHGWYEDCFGHLVLAIADGFGILSEPAGATTFRHKQQEVGAEADKAYYFGANAERMKGPQEIDLKTQPPPDLVIEVEVTHPAADAVEVWSRLEVPEIWHFNVQRWTLVFILRREDGSYAPSPRSAAFPVLEPADV